MHIRTFRAASLQDALEEIRHQMGPDASVLHTRQVRDGWMGWLGRTYVEVTAGLKDTVNLKESSSSGDSARQASVGSRRDFDGATEHVGTQLKVVSDRGLPTQNNGLVSRSASPTIPLVMQGYRDEMLSLGVDPETADRWIGATISFAGGLGETTSSVTNHAIPWLEHLQRTIAREVRLGSPISTPPGDRRIVALVGPTGVGKTTTVAKLAAGFRLQAKRRVGLLTIDTFRIAAVQQLRAYADIMDLPMEVVESPEQMRPALGRLGDVDLVLIDTAGRSPRSDARIEQLVDFLRNAQPDETHLVLSSTSSVSSIRATLKGFAPVRPTAAILSKLDEAPQTAGILSALTSSTDHTGLPLSYVTTGQQVPDDIDVAKHDYLLTRLLQPRMDMSPMEAA
ncbi:Flagellar biosynthesis protein FlhF [Rubripirellula amarantea]|uniref:Flagellar biosynthesis protein FlhF n=1 Tax=Rubripirellula amarantea TaxID=2527999 RepID=A0A5C5WRQ1_9BACT|nr:flagellar biosynthesis protein FlhF [Rubripirellula amarantea]TWT53130.1 Flagellar biosynthesis protein FlhF [Rubripirellula amarantea]